jgi:hypothetical protein
LDGLASLLNFMAISFVRTAMIGNKTARRRNVIANGDGFMTRPPQLSLLSIPMVVWAGAILFAATGQPGGAPLSLSDKPPPIRDLGADTAASTA